MFLRKSPGSPEVLSRFYRSTIFRLDQVHLLLAELSTYELQVKKVERMIKVNQSDIETYRSKIVQLGTNSNI